MITNDVLRRVPTGVETERRVAGFLSGGFRQSVTENLDRRSLRRHPDALEVARLDSFAAAGRRTLQHIIIIIIIVVVVVIIIIIIIIIVVVVVVVVTTTALIIIVVIVVVV